MQSLLQRVMLFIDMHSDYTKVNKMSHSLASKGVPFSSILGLIVRRSIAKSSLIAFPR